MEKLLGLFKSRKFWAAVVGVVFVFISEFVPEFPLDQEQVLNVVMLFVAYILGVAIDDNGTGARKV